MFRKQILKRGQLKYGDRTLDFDRPYFDKIAAAFRDRAFDAVPLQLSDEKGAHNNSPLLTRGDVVGVEADDNGLYATVSLTDEGADLVREHPNLGVSVRIVEDFERGDGRSWPAALQHVLACWQPRVAGMSPWQSIEASTPDIAVIDLSGLTFSDAPTTSASSPGDGKPDVPPQEGQTMAPQVTEEELAAIRSVVSLLPTLQKLVAPAEGETKPDEGKPAATVTPIVKPVVEQKPAEGADEDANAEQAIAAATGDGEGKVVDLALVELRTTADRQAIELAEIKADRDNQRWNYEREQLVRDYGIFPAIVALAEPLLKGAKHVVELSGGGSVDAGDVMRSVLHTVAKTYGKGVDLSGPTGTALEADGEAEKKAERDRIHASARAAGFGK